MNWKLLQDHEHVAGMIPFFVTFNGVFRNFSSNLYVDKNFFQPHSILANHVPHCDSAGLTTSFSQTTIFWYEICCLLKVRIEILEVYAGLNHESSSSSD